VPARKQTPELVLALGQALKAERAKRDLSQEELAARAGLDRTYLSGVERGLRVPNLRSLIRLASALEIRVSKLLAAAEALAGER
jgi:transcriptional regulator with XRE-family HTH domain